MIPGRTGRISRSLELTDISDINEFDDEDQNTDDLFSFGKKVKISLEDMDYVFSV